jgi:hypothetical protein
LYVIVFLYGTGRESFESIEAIRTSWRYPIFSVRCDHLYSSFFEPFIKWVTVISSVTNESFWSIREKILFESFLDKGDFMWRSTSCVEHLLVSKALPI